jgi:hypothetical protein
MAEAVKQGHNFANDIQYEGGSTYRVVLHGPAPQSVYFNGYYNDNDPSLPAGSSNFWPILMQRARLQALGIDPQLPHSANDWNLLNQWTGSRLFSVNDALTMFTGNPAFYSDMSRANPWAMANDLARGDLIVVSSNLTGGVNANGIIGNHAYAVLAVYYEDSMWKVRLYNPWGTDRENGQTMDSLQKYSSPSTDGYITLSWSQFVSTANFRGYAQSSLG